MLTTNTATTTTVINNTITTEERVIALIGEGKIKQVGEELIKLLLSSPEEARMTGIDSLLWRWIIYEPISKARKSSNDNNSDPIRIRLMIDRGITILLIRILPNLKVNKRIQDFLFSNFRICADSMMGVNEIINVVSSNPMIYRILIWIGDLYRYKGDHSEMSLSFYEEAYHYRKEDGHAPNQIAVILTTILFSGGTTNNADNTSISVNKSSNAIRSEKKIKNFAKFKIICWYIEAILAEGEPFTLAKNNLTIFLKRIRNENEFFNLLLHILLHDCVIKEIPGNLSLEEKKILVPFLLLNPAIGRSWLERNSSCLDLLEEFKRFHPSIISRATTTTSTITSSNTRSGQIPIRKEG